jgi:hypothetical protein
VHPGRPEANDHRSQDKELLWGQNRKARTRRGPLGETEAPQAAGRGNWPEVVEVAKREALDAEIGNTEKLADVRTINVALRAALLMSRQKRSDGTLLLDALSCGASQAAGYPCSFPHAGWHGERRGIMSGSALKEQR